MRALKVLVVVMGVLILAGTVTVVAVIVQRAGGGGGLGRQAAGLDLALNQPDGARIAGVAAAEGGGLAVWVARPDGDRVVLVDTRRGRVAGEIRLGR